MLQLLKKKAAEFTESHKEEINILEGPGIGSLIQNVGWLNILYFAIQDFPTLAAMYGPEWAEHLEKRIRAVITKEGKRTLTILISTYFPLTRENSSYWTLPII